MIIKVIFVIYCISTITFIT